MSTQLAEEGWLAPANPGPARRHVAITVGVGGVALLAWMTFALGWTEPDTSDRPVEVQVAADGVVRIDGRAAEVEVRTRGGTSFLVARATRSGDTRTDIALEADPGVDRERIAVRLVPASGRDDRLRVLVAISTDSLPDLGAVPRARGTLRKLTQPLDDRADRVQADARVRDRLRSSWWLISLTGLAGAVCAPLLLWRRTQRGRFSMRRPGSGTELEVAPPSSLDPVGAAVLVAGARPVDASAAFAGHVLDLVERKQLLMRRTLDPTHGTGVLIGLAQADELDDWGVHALRSVALDDGLTVAVPDSHSKLRRAPVADRLGWEQHVAARGRFEALVDRFDTRRLLIASTVAGLLALATLVAGLLADLPGLRAAWWLGAALTLPAAVALAMWMRDARTWRVVARARRLERAQWLAWRAAVGAPDGPVLDQRNLPVVAATGRALAGVRTFAGPDAVALDAVTAATIVSLRAMLHDA